MFLGSTNRTTSNIIVIKTVIPKGAEYYIGSGGDIVSNKLNIWKK